MVCLICFSLCKAHNNYFITEDNVRIGLNSNPFPHAISSMIGKGGKREEDEDGWSSWTLTWLSKGQKSDCTDLRGCV